MGTKFSKKTSGEIVRRLENNLVNIYKIIGGQNLPMNEEQEHILKPYFNIDYGFVDQFINRYVLAYSIEMVVSYVCNLDTKLYSLSNELISIDGDTTKQFKYSIAKTPFMYKYFRSTKWINTVTKIVSEKYVPIQIKSIDTKVLDVGFLVKKKNYLNLIY